MAYKNLENLISILKRARKNAKLSQGQLAKKMKTKQPSISRTENGSNVTIKFAERWAKACGYDLRFNHISIENEKTREMFFTQPYD